MEHCTLVAGKGLQQAAGTHRTQVVRNHLTGVHYWQDSLCIFRLSKVTILALITVAQSGVAVGVALEAISGSNCESLSLDLTRTEFQLGS